MLKLINFAFGQAFPDFERDTSKAETNLRKHGVSFEEAADVFMTISLTQARIG